MITAPCKICKNAGQHTSFGGRFLATAGPYSPNAMSGWGGGGGGIAPPIFLPNSVWLWYTQMYWEVCVLCVSDSDVTKTKTEPMVMWVVDVMQCVYFIYDMDSLVPMLCLSKWVREG